MRIDTMSRPNVGTALRDLGARQKPSAGAPAYSRFVNRPLGRVIAAVAYSIGLTPNAVTAISAVLTFSAIAVLALAPSTAFIGVTVTVLLVLGYAFDSADGQIARLRGGGSAAGEWLDHMVDATKQVSLHLAVLVAWWRSFELHEAWLLVPLGYTVVATVFFFGVILTEQLRRQAGTASAPGSAIRTSPLYAIAVLPADYGFLCLAFLLLGWHQAFVVVYTLLFAANAAILALSAVRWYRAIARLPR